MRKHHQSAVFYLLLAAILWSTSGLFIKLVDWHPVAIAGARSGISALVIMIYMKKLTFRLTRLKVLGAVLYAAMVILFVIANKLTSSANAILLQFTAPIWVALFSGWILKEKTDLADWLAIGAVLAGMVLFFLNDLDGGQMLGNLLSIISGICFAGVVILLKLQQGGSAIEMTLLGNVLTFMIGIPFFFTAMPSFSSMAGIAFMGVFQLGISYILYAKHIHSVTAIEAILIPVIEPLLNPIWVMLFTQEVPGTFAILGGTVVVGAIVARSLYKYRRMTAQVREEG